MNYTPELRGIDDKTCAKMGYIRNNVGKGDLLNIIKVDQRLFVPHISIMILYLYILLYRTSRHVSTPI